METLYFHLPSALPVAAEQRELIAALIATCHVMADEAAWAQHAAAVAALPALTERIMQLCLSHANVLAVALLLPEERRPGVCTWHCAGQLCHLLCSTSLLPGALVACLDAGGSSSAAAAVSATAQIVQQVPLDETLPGFTGHQNHSNCVALVHAALGNVCCTVQKHSAVWRQLSGQERRRMAAQLLPLASRLPQLLQLMCDGLQQAATPRRDKAEQVLVAASLQLALLWQLRTDEEGAQGSSCQGQVQLIDSRADAVLWCSAACGALQCLPLAQQLQTRRSPEESVPTAFAVLAVRLAGLVATGLVPAGGRDLTGSTLTAADEALPAAVWQLHSQLARLVHSLAAAEGALAPLRNAWRVEELLDALSKCMTQAVRLQCSDTLAYAAEGLPPSKDHKPSRWADWLLLWMGLGGLTGYVITFRNCGLSLTCTNARHTAFVPLLLQAAAGACCHTCGSPASLSSPP